LSRIIKYVWHRKYGVGELLDEQKSRMLCQVAFLKPHKIYLMSTETVYGIGDYEDTDENKELAIRKGKRFKKLLGDVEDVD